MSLNLSEELLNSVKGVYDGFNARLCKLPYEWTEDDLTVSGNFFYLSFRNGEPTVDEFVQYIYYRIVPFCISRRERREKREKYFTTGDERYIHELTDKAKQLFIRARNSKKTAGEPGELILFMLLEAILKAPQLACKMSLKTSEQMPVHGSDAIHIGHGSQDDSICLIWGESKIYQQLSDALDEICSSISSFLSEQNGRTGRDRDIDIIRDHMDIEDPKLRDALLKYFDPYTEEGNLCEEAYSCFVGFEYSVYNQLQKMSFSEREEFLKDEYLQRIHKACNQFGQKLRKNSLSHLKIHYFLIPFPSVEELRGKFFGHLGVTP